MSSKSVLEYLHDLCRDIDAGRPLKPYLYKAVVPAALTIGIVGASGCSSGDDQPTTPDDDVTTETQCADGVDNDADGAIDCSDNDCVDWAECQSVVEYGAPVMDEPSDPAPLEPREEPSSEPAVDMYAAPFE